MVVMEIEMVTGKNLLDWNVTFCLKKDHKSQVVVLKDPKTILNQKVGKQ